MKKHEKKQKQLMREMQSKWNTQGKEQMTYAHTRVEQLMREYNVTLNDVRHRQASVTLMHLNKSKSELVPVLF
jgi:polyhydroxyalkanoate synthesis regulator phasin